MQSDRRRKELLAGAERMQKELDYLRAPQRTAGPGETPHDQQRKPVDWTTLWGLSRHIAKAHIAADLVQEGRHEVYYRHMRDENGVPHLECVCGAMIPGDDKTLSRAQFLNAPGHIRDSQRRREGGDPSQPDPWLAENWPAAVQRYTLGELRSGLEEERWTLARAISEVESDSDSNKNAAELADWLAGARRHLARLHERIKAINKDEHRPYVQEQDTDGLWWVVCTCGARIEGRLGETLNELGFRRASHLGLRGEPDEDMRSPTPPWITR
jgi:hypothetical protein